MSVQQQLSQGRSSIQVENVKNYAHLLQVSDVTAVIKQKLLEQGVAMLYSKQQGHIASHCKCHRDKQKI